MNVKIVPSKSVLANGTKVYVENVPISGVTEIKLSAVADSLWQCSLTVNPEITGQIMAELLPSQKDSVWAAALAEATHAVIRANVFGEQNLEMAMRNLQNILSKADVMSSVGAPSWDDHPWPHIFFTASGLWVGTSHDRANDVNIPSLPNDDPEWEVLCHGTCEAGEETFRSRPESDDRRAR